MAQHKPLPPVRLQPAKMSAEDRTELVLFMGLARATMFSSGTLEKRMTGVVKGAINRATSMLKTMLDALLGVPFWVDGTADKLAEAETRKKKGEVLGAAIYEVAREFQKSGYKPEMLLLMKGFNAGEVITPDGAPMKELNLKALAQQEDVLAAQGLVPPTLHPTVAQCIDRHIDDLEAYANGLDPAERVLFYVTLGERCGVIAKYHHDRLPDGA